MTRRYKDFSPVQDASLAAANAASNAALPADATPLTDDEYWDKVSDAVLKSYQDTYIKITSGAFLLRFPAGKLDQIKAAAAANPQLAAYVAEVEQNPYVYTGSTRVRTGIAMLVQAGLLTAAQADAILLP